jgi:hypothetical protein
MMSARLSAEVAGTHFSDRLRFAPVESEKPLPSAQLS